MVTMALAGLFLVCLSPEHLKMRYFSPPACGGQSPRHEGYITNLLPGEWDRAQGSCLQPMGRGGVQTASVSLGLVCLVGEPGSRNDGPYIH